MASCHVVKTCSSISTCLVWESESDESGSKALVVCFLGEIDHGHGGYFGGLGVPDWACWKWVFRYHYRYYPAFFRLEVSQQLSVSCFIILHNFSKVASAKSDTKCGYGGLWSAPFVLISFTTHNLHDDFDRGAGHKDGRGHEDLLRLTDSTVQFVGITAFHTQIADPLIGGTYMTVSLFKCPQVIS
jgi:hypothetical protein